MHRSAASRTPGWRRTRASTSRTSTRPARAHGGPGRFALRPAAHLTEGSPLLTPDTAARLLDQWRPHWDLARPVLVEKSPPNLLMTRFLQGAFGDARFVMVVRHPAIVSLSTRKWARLRSLGALLDHWFAAHRLFEEDAPFLHHLLVVKYEHLVADPRRTLAEIAAFLELDGEIPADGIDTRRSATYERQWAELVQRRPLAPRTLPRPLPPPRARRQPLRLQPPRPRPRRPVPGRFPRIP